MILRKVFLIVYNSDSRFFCGFQCTIYFSMAYTVKNTS